MSWWRRASSKPLPLWQSLLVGLACGAFGAAARWIVPAPIGAAAPFEVYFPFVALAAAFGGLSGGLVALIIATVTAVTWRENPGPAFSGSLAVFLAASGLIVALLAARRRIIAKLLQSEESLSSANNRLQTVAGELAHRNRNSLFVIMSIVNQSARAAASASEAAGIINSRLEALVRAQDLLIESGTGTISLTRLIDRALEPFGSERFEITPATDVDLATDVGIGLGLVFHELATNAVKHGAFSASSGRVLIGWRREGEEVRLSWRERGGPQVRLPERRGFGSRLFEVALVPQGGKAECRYETEGLTCELTIPAPLRPPTYLSAVPEGSAFARPEIGYSAQT
ncbi:MAG TPA: sensor histidine kinase [Caulobacteraceae bacterium]